MNIITRQSIQIASQCGNERFTFARAHFSDFAIVQRHGANELNIEMTKTDGAHTGFTNGSERLRKQIVQIFAVSQTLTEFDGKASQLFVGTCLHSRLEGVDLCNPTLIVLEWLAFAYAK